MKPAWTPASPSPGESSHRGAVAVCHTAEEAVRDAARALVSRNATSGRDPTPSPAASPEALWSAWNLHVQVLSRAQHSILDPLRLARISWLARRYLAGRGAVFEARRRELGIAGDPLAAVAATAVDFEYQGDKELVVALFDAYREFSGDVFPASVAHHYLALEATSRASLAVGAREADDLAAVRVARALMLLAVRHLEMGRIHLTLVGGEPGTGKSTLAARLADACGWMLLSSVQVRADVPGSSLPLGLRADWTSGRPDPALATAAYAELLHRAGLLLERGQSVILDATWSDRAMRARAAIVANAAAADLVAMRCDAGERLRDARIRDRIAAGPAIAEAAISICHRIAAGFQPWPEATIIDTRQPTSGSLATALRAIGTQVSSAQAPALEEGAAL